MLPSGEIWGSVATSSAGVGTSANSPDVAAGEGDSKSKAIYKKLLDEGLSIVDVYSRVVEAEEAVRLERSEKKKVELYN